MIQRLLGDLIFVVPEEFKTASGLVIAGAKKEEIRTGRVAFAGPGKTVEIGGKVAHIPMEIAQGDRIMFEWNAGSKHTVGDTEYLVMHQGDVACVLDDEAQVGYGWRP